MCMTVIHRAMCMACAGQCSHMYYKSCNAGISANVQGNSRTHANAHLSVMQGSARMHHVVVRARLRTRSNHMYMMALSKDYVLSSHTPWTMPQSG
jgi:anaerobic selenocysteine-containing dehydrogenase